MANINANKQLYVERDTFEKNGKTYFSYFIKGNVRGKDVKASLMPPDRGGYSVLDIVFGDGNTADLVVVPFEMRDEATGRIITGNTYKAQTVDENGESYECKVQPARASDKSMLAMLLR